MFARSVLHAGAPGAGVKLAGQERGATLSLLRGASAEAHVPLESAVREPLERRFGHDLSGVHVHSGAASAKAAEMLSARAYTLGNDVFLGAEARALSDRERHRLLAHEAVHTVQQGGVPASIRPQLRVSAPNDSAEREAEAIASSATGREQGASLGGDHASAGPGPGIVRLCEPLLQRDLKGAYTVKDGTFDLNLVTQSNPGATSGLSGTIAFTPSEGAPDSKLIKLLQVVRLEDLSTAKDYAWTGGEANRNKVQTVDDGKKGVAAGYFVDHSAAAAAPRTKKTDAAVSPYYRSYWPNAANSQDGSKQGKSTSPASLWDYPGWASNGRFSFETAAKAADTGYDYAAIRWGFTISDASKGKVEAEYANVFRGQSATFGAAVKAFNEFYKNPGASTAPTK